MNSKKYELPISSNYVNNWGIKEAIREILQNAVDANECGYDKEISYDKNTSILTIKNMGAKLPISSLVLGNSSKGDMKNQIGQFGEGYKIALVVLLRKGFGITIINSDELWTPSFEFSENFKSQILTISSEEIKDKGFVSFEINGVSQELFNELYNYFPCIDDDFGEVISCDNGQILLDEKFSGMMFVEGLYIQSDKNFKYGYNFNTDAVQLDRDRKAINYYELKALTAESIITAEECHPKIFKAISDSYMDTKDIKDVIDKASESFLNEYRDMFYCEHELEENTLVATDSVKKQIEQMDLDIEVVKGSEIESYLIAKANDKLGIIEKAKEEIKAKDEIQDAFDTLIYSSFQKLMMWFMNIKRYLPKKWIKEFYDVQYYFAPYNLKLIKEYIPEDFDYTNESIIELKEKVVNERKNNEEN